MNMNTEILENRNNFLIIKENNLIKLFSYKSLVSIYNIETKQIEYVPYTFKNVYGASSDYSVTTARHLNRFKKYIQTNL